MTALRFNFRPGQFRLLLAVLVVFSHMSFVEIGRPAVFVFFMLSGYWVLRMYEQKYRPHAAVWVFYLSRFMRIWLAFATAFLAVFLIAAMTDPKPLALLGGLPLLGIATTKRDLLGTSWSLDIELQFYLLVPILSLALIWVGRNPGRAVLAGLIAVGLTGLGWVLQLNYGLWTVLSYLPPFLIGALIWHLQARPSGGRALAGVLLFAAVGLAVALTPMLQPLLLRDVGGPFNEDWFGMGWIALLTPFVIWNVQQKSSAFDLHLGNYSYALYITHWPVIAGLRTVLQPLSLTDRVLILGVVLGVSVTFYVIVDRGWERLRHATIRRLTAAQSKHA
jgi:peptidoglycan/LPS O-acetylase OafA/YrhL